MQTRVYKLSRANRFVFPVLLVFFILGIIGGYAEQKELLRQGEAGEAGLLIALGVLLLTGLICLWILTSRWRLRIDDQGVAMRALWRYRLSPWRDFEDGTLVRPDGSTATFRQRNTRRSLLCLSQLSKTDRKEVLQAIAEHWRESDPGPPPTTLELRFRDPLDRRRVALDELGITVRQGKRREHHDWADVARVLIVRPERGRRDFCRLVIDLPSQSLRFGTTRSAGSFQGASTATLAAFLSRQVSSDRLVEFIADEEPADERHAVILRDDYLNELRAGRGLFLALQLLSAPAFAIGFYVARMGHPDTWLAAPSFGLFVALLVVAASLTTRWPMQRKVRQLNRILSHLEEKQED